MTPEVEKKFQSAQWKFIIGSMVTYAFFYLTRKNLSMAQPLMLEEGVFIVSGVTLLYYLTSAKNWLLKIAPYGKMSLTNYIGQSIIGAILFYNWGFGLYQVCGVAASFAMGAGCVALQFIFCTWWMKHHKRGPLEQIWCTATWLGKKN